MASKRRRRHSKYGASPGGSLGSLTSKRCSGVDRTRVGAPHIREREGKPGSRFRPAGGPKVPSVRFFIFLHSPGEEYLVAAQPLFPSAALCFFLFFLRTSLQRCDVCETRRRLRAKYECRSADKETLLFLNKVSFDEEVLCTWRFKVDSALFLRDVILLCRYRCSPFATINVKRKGFSSKRKGSMKCH